MSTNRLAIVSAVMLSIVTASCTGSPSINMDQPATFAISPPAADLITTQSVQFTTNVSSNANGLVWSVNGVVSGNASVGTIDATGDYLAPVSQPSAPVTVTVSSMSNPSHSASAMVTVVGTGQVAATANPQVALYTIAPPVPAMVSIQFGTDTTYGRTTWTQSATGNAASLPTFVAGMKSNTLYHMRAVLQMPDGTQLPDFDHTFTTGTIPATAIPKLTVTNPSGMVPQSGVEMFDLIGSAGSTVNPVVATDLSGNVLWTYNPGGIAGDIVQPVKLLPNGHFIIVDAPTSAAPLSTTPPPAGTLDVAREIDLTGATIREISIDTLNSRLATAGFNYTAGVIHHDVAVLPNGHWILIVNSTQQFTNLTGLPGTTTVLGDALIDLDTNLNPVWMWNTFDHLDVNRHPMQFPDWTHANAIIYSPTDGDLLLSMRHQNWIIKIDYANGKGAGDILWHLGYQGEFTLDGGTTPTDWFYAQHGPSFTTQSTAGTFGLAVFDNGDDRVFPAGVTCATSGAPTCPYSTAQVLTVNETAKTATLSFHDITPTYSNFGGNAEVLANANVEFDLCSVPGTTPSAAVLEVTPTSPAQTVLQMSIASLNVYRAFRMPSLYPGVQW
jgi:arylsulfate sulfotransferase